MKGCSRGEKIRRVPQGRAMLGYRREHHLFVAPQRVRGVRELEGFAPTFADSRVSVLLPSSRHGARQTQNQLRKTHSAIGLLVCVPKPSVAVFAKQPSMKHLLGSPKSLG